MKNQFKETMTTEELQEYDQSWFRGEIVVVDDLKKFSRVMPLLRKEKVLGFDTETKPSFRKGHRNKVSLMQLSTADTAFLFRINMIGLPPALADLLADPGIVKTGVAVHDDIKVLSGIRRFEYAGFIDLQKFVKDFGIQSSGLKKLTAIVLGFRISKRQQVTDWEAEELSEAQQVYAATDAWVCREIFCKLTRIN